MTRWFITDFVGKKVKAWLFGEAEQTVATKTGTAARAAIEGAAALKSVALWAWTAAKNIMTSAWEAMAAAWKAIVGIPVVGPVLAPIAAAAAFAGVSKLAKNVASAEGGYDIPKGVNPLVQAHEEEMILPRQYANVIRSMSMLGDMKSFMPKMPTYGMPQGLNPLAQMHDEEGVLPQQYANVIRGMAGGSEGGGSGETHHHHYEVNAMDARSLRDYLRKNSHAMAPALRQMARNFTPIKG